MQGSGRREARRYYAVTFALSLLVGFTAESGVEKVMMVQALKQTGKSDEVSCREVQTRIRSTCYRNITTKEPYACSAEEACLGGRAGTADACTRDRFRNGASQCQRSGLERQCRSVLGTCYRRERQVREYPCPGRKICKLVPTEVEHTCVRKSSTQEAYPCEKQKFDRICTDVQVPVEEVCHREETRTVQHPCTRTEIQRVCQSVVPAASTEICYRTVMRAEEYACMKTEMKKTCTQEPAEVPSTCTSIVPRERRYPCTRRVALQRCRNGIVRRAAMCSKKVKVQQPYECGDRQQQADCAGTAEPTCKDKKCKIRRLPSASCHKGTLGRSRMCYRDVDQVLEYPCATADADGCELVEEEVADTCTETANEEESHPCTKVEYREKCEEVPTEVPATCQREVSAQEAYPCPQAKQAITVCEHRPIEVEHTCQKQITVQVPYNCAGTETRTECRKAIVKYQGTCYKKVPKAEEYACTKIEKKRECTQEPKMCAETVFAEVPYECSRTVCEHVQLPQERVCNSNFSSRQSSGNGARPGEPCSLREVSGTRTCYRDVVAQKPFPCYKTTIKNVCGGLSSPELLVQG